MATAVVDVLDCDQKPLECRTLIDTCSNANYITQRFAKKLRLPQRAASATIEALNDLNTLSDKIVSTAIKSKTSRFQRDLTFLVIPNISGPIPDTNIDRSKLRIPVNLKLADPNFHRPASVDMLIGTGPSLASLSIGQIDLSTSNGPDLILQKTQFGWIIGGSVLSASSRVKHRTFVSNFDFDISKFWTIEEGPREHHLTAEERECEDHFIDHVKRDDTGRYVVALPFNAKRTLIGETRTQAINRFLSLERKLQRDPSLREEYSAVMKEYLTLGHMSKTKPQNANGFYLPHHAVIKSSSSTTKVRVVFDGSAKSSSGLSLNDALNTGPTIQDDIFALLIRFRLHTYVLTGDIEKMYRQVLIRPEDRRYQRVLWRNERNEIADYELNTVTFGLCSAPFLAIRSIHQLADDEQADFPRAATTLKRDLYVDDLLTGANTHEEAKNLRDEIMELLQRGRFNIRQWISNDPELLEGLNKEQIHPKFFDESTVKTLGISWDARNDSIAYAVDFHAPTKITKRTILSTIARIFDPLGLLAPVTVVAKLIMQRLWQLKLNWDESLPASLHTEWIAFVEEIGQLNNISFDRNVGQPSAQRLELHGFCDASERAYGACIYVRSVNNRGEIVSKLLCAKSRVAPLKTVSLARLELCGAVLLASLYVTVREAMHIETEHVNFWTDSTIVLNWIQKEPCTLKTFVANRVADIQGKTDIAAWRHVRSQDNPADLLSRGQSPAQFLRDSNWRHGPEWLSTIESTWPKSKFDITEDVPEVKRLKCLATVSHTDEILTRYSDISRLIRITAYCLRFRQPRKNKGPLTVEELQSANEQIIRLVQASAFAQDLQNLKTGSNLHAKSKLLPLHPFIDERGILRVGGRLQNSKLQYAQKHPILLPKGHHITDLIIRDKHVSNHHAGITTTLYAVRQKYWPIDGRNATRKIVRQCVRCFRVNPPTPEYIMGNLPASRVTETRPFYNCGVDYCGPFYIKERRFRNRTKVKIYVAVFICLATKAVHLEVASDMTTEAFIAALKRLIARRGICRNIYSDNGSNFVGANNELRELQQILKADSRVENFLAGKGITWHFMPALSPHFGGIWEAAVKSFKHHVKRVVGDELFTFEQFNTFITEVEAILNSRPLTPLSSDPHDPLALTPGHFLIGNPLTSLPEADLTSTPTNRLSKWQHIQKVKQDFWTRWHKEYINHLNVRQRWSQGSHNIQEGTIVVLKDDNLPPLQWHLGRIEKIHPGEDNVIRAVSVRTSTGVYRRNVKQLAPLPVEDTH
ncbi:uncharacterized protein LOC143261513 [Megalopta genalis]|uniref:uncharacterized protein LOC143261513 n=1 Tax=Megalopta genalis TaxID=115081 RepID=UPI003FD217C3